MGWVSFEFLVLVLFYEIFCFDDGRGCGGENRLYLKVSEEFLVMSDCIR